MTSLTTGWFRVSPPWSWALVPHLEHWQPEHARCPCALVMGTTKLELLWGRPTRHIQREWKCLCVLYTIQSLQRSALTVDHPYLQDIHIAHPPQNVLLYRLALPPSWSHQVPDKLCGFWQGSCHTCLSLKTTRVSWVASRLVETGERSCSQQDPRPVGRKPMAFKRVFLLKYLYFDAKFQGGFPALATRFPATYIPDWSWNKAPALPTECLCAHRLKPNAHKILRLMHPYIKSGCGSWSPRVFRKDKPQDWLEVWKWTETKWTEYFLNSWVLYLQIIFLKRKHVVSELSWFMKTPLCRFIWELQMSKTSSKNSAAFTASSISNYQSAFPNIPRLCSLSSGFGGASWHSRSIGATWLYQVGLTFPHSNCPWQQFHLQREQGPSQDTKEMWKRDWQRGSKEGLPAALRRMWQAGSIVAGDWDKQRTTLVCRMWQCKCHRNAEAAVWQLLVFFSCRLWWVFLTVKCGEWMIMISHGTSICLRFQAISKTKRFVS